MDHYFFSEKKKGDHFLSIIDENVCCALNPRLESNELMKIETPKKITWPEITYFSTGVCS